MNIFPGEEAFKLKDTLGVPLAVTFLQCSERDTMIDWVGFIEAARSAGWWDYQTWDAIQEAFNDSGAWPDLRPGIEFRFKQYVLLKKHPLMLHSLQS